MKSNIFSILVGCALLLGAALVQAEEIQFTAEVSSNQVTLGSSVQLTLTVNGVTNIGDLHLPQLENFDVQYLGPSTNISFINGKQYSSKSYNYSLLPQKTGRFLIQPFNITLNGQTYSTETIELQVVDTQPGADPNSQQQASLKDRINLVMRVPKKEVMINEPLAVKVMLLVSNVRLQYNDPPKVNSIGFSAGDFEQPHQYQQIINGVRYDIVEFDTIVYPTRTGELTLGPAEFDCNIVEKGQIFNDPFFSALFEQQKRPLHLTSEPVTIKVSDLPAEGKPEDFSGAVGDFDFDVSVSPTDVQVGDPITLRMSLKGRGNLKAIELPDFADTENFKIYKPNIREENEGKSLEQVIIPLNEKITQVPALSFNYYDPQMGKYQTVSKGPFPLRVKPLEEGQTLDVTGIKEPAAKTAPEEKLGEDIDFIKSNLGSLRKVRAGPIAPWYFLLMMLGLAGWIAGFAYFQWTHRLATDEAFARRLRAPKQARKDLNHAKALLAAGKEKEFYDAIFKSFQHYLSHKFQLPPGQVSPESIAREWADNNSHRDVIKSIEQFFSECESVRYASVNISPEQMQQSLRQVEKLIDHLERHVK